MTYNVFGGTLNLPQSIRRCSKVRKLPNSNFYINAAIKLIHRSSPYEYQSTRPRHTDVPRPSLAAVSERHRFQAVRARLSMSSQSVATVSVRVHQCVAPTPSSPPPVVVILAATVNAHGFSLSAIIVRFRSPLQQSASMMSPRLQLSLFSESLPFPDHFLPSCFQFQWFCTPCIHRV